MSKNGQGEGADDDHDDQYVPGGQVEWLDEACPWVGSFWIFQEERIGYLQ